MKRKRTDDALSERALKSGKENENKNKAEEDNTAKAAYRRLLLEACLALLAIVFTAVILHLTTREKEAFADGSTPPVKYGMSGGVTLSDAVQSAICAIASDGADSKNKNGAECRSAPQEGKVIR